MKSNHITMARGWVAACLLALAPATTFARTAEDSFHFRNLSSEAPEEAVRPDLFPQLAAAGDLVHLTWISQLPDQAGERLMYRRSSDGGLTFEEARILLEVGPNDSLANGLMQQDAETGGYPAYMAADGQQVHIALMVFPLSGAAQIVYLRSTDGGGTFSTPSVWATVNISPPEPPPGLRHVAGLNPPMVAASEGRVVIAYGYLDARVFYDETPGFSGWKYGYWHELSVSWSANGGDTFQPSVLHGAPPTNDPPSPSQILIQGDDVLFATRDRLGEGWGAQRTRVYAGVSQDGGANIHFSQLTPETTRTYSNNLVRMIKHGDHVVAYFVNGDDSEATLETLYQCRSTDGGTSWSAPQRLTDPPSELLGTFDLGAAGFSVAQNGPEILLATAYYIPNVSAGRLAVRRSTDGGATYSAWETLADATDPGASLLVPLHWPRLALWPAAPGQARASLLWGGNNLVTTHDSGISYSPALMVRPPSQVLPPTGSPYAPHVVASADGTLHIATSSTYGPDLNQTDVFYRRIPAASTPDTDNQALSLGSNLPPPDDVSEPRHRDSLQVAAAPGLAAGDAFTIEFWVRYQGNAEDRELFASGATGGELSLSTTTFGGTNRFQIQLQTDQGFYHAVGTTVVPQPGRWYHVALRYDAARASGQLALVVDGQSDTVVDAAGSRAATAHPFIFGNYFLGGGESDFIGDIDEIRFWNQALEDAAILAGIFTPLTGDEPGLAAWFPLDGNTRDATGNVPDGLLACREYYVDGVSEADFPPPPRKDQQISFPAPGKHAMGDPVFALEATSDSGLPIQFKSSNQSVAKILRGGKVKILGAGKATITATQTGNEKWNAAPTVHQVLKVAKGVQKVSFETDKTQVFKKGRKFKLKATSNSGLPVSIRSSNSAIIAVRGNTATIRGKGRVVLTAKQNGNKNWRASAPVSRMIIVR